MCVVSNVYDHYADRWDKYIQPNIQPYVTPRLPTQEELDEFRDLLEKARELDRKLNQPDCEMESKKQKLRDLADELGLEIDFIEED